MASTHAEISTVSATTSAPRRLDIWPGTFFAAVIFASIVILALLAIVVGLSFRTGSLGAANSAWSFANYPTIFLDGFTYRVLANTIGFAATTLVVALVIGVPLAWLAERSDLPAKSLLFTLTAIGLLLPGFGSAMGWLFLMHPRIGLANVWLERTFHLGDPIFNIASVTGMGWVQGLSLAPLAFIMTAAVFRASDPALEEAAQISGATFGKRIWRVTLPLAWPGVLAAGIYIFTIGFAAFDVPAIIGWSNRVFTFSTYLVLQLSPTDALPRYGNAATLSVLLLGFAGFFSWWYARMQQGAYRYQVVRGKAYRPQLVALGWMKGPVWCAIGLYLTLSIVLPLLVVIWASLLPYFQLPSAAAFASASLARYWALPWDLVADGLKNTAILMVLTPTLTLALALAFSWVVLRSRLPGRNWFDFVAFLPHAMPSIVFSVGALLIALFVIQRFAPAFGTLWLLLVAFIVGRISYATRMTNTGLIQIHKELEESGEVGGATTGGVLAKIVVPLLAPTLLNAWLWIALLTFRELTLAVLLTTRDNITLPVVIWSLWLGGGLGDAAAVALVMLCLMTPIIAIYWFVARKTGLRAN
ncbi:MAG TPA: iron ABC transporter permease [Stellaceae bacterium]|nr:iron ABC transporter permease [Stellaceae bacterium]